MRRSAYFLISLVAAALLVRVMAQEAETKAPESRSVATVLQINGAIGPATSRYIEKGMQAAQDNGSRLIVLEMDTPGGLDTSMRDIIRAILASKVPVATYVTPSGSRAASAGTYILYASHIAAMAPATNLGAATPVSIGGDDTPGAGGDTPDDEEDSPDADAKDGKAPDAKDRKAADAKGEADSAKKLDDKPAVEKPAAEKPKRPAREGRTAMERKVVNDAVAYIRGLAELRGRNAEWAEDAVRGAASLSATQAREQKVIDVIARDLPDLLNQIDGRIVEIANDKKLTLATRGLTIERIDPDWRTELLSVLTNPTIAYGLLLIGIYGLLFEGYNPGVVLPGVVGAIALICALFAFQILSVNYAGLALIALGIAMMIAEFFVASFGALGLGGLVAFVVGSIILLDTDIPGMSIGVPVISAVATVGGLVVFGIVWVAQRSMRRPVVTGVQGMEGATAEALADFSDTGTVRYGGELWNARTRAPVRAGQSVRIVKVDGLLLWVEPGE
jgi:membrane-bound serine protease (ClpP class)